MNIFKTLLVLLFTCTAVWASNIYVQPNLYVSFQNGKPVYSMYGFYITEGFNCNHAFYHSPYCERPIPRPLMPPRHPQRSPFRHHFGR